MWETDLVVRREQLLRDQKRWRWRYSLPGGTEAAGCLNRTVAWQKLPGTREDLPPCLMDSLVSTLSQQKCTYPAMYPPGGGWPMALTPQAQFKPGHPLSPGRLKSGCLRSLQKVKLDKEMNNTALASGGVLSDAHLQARPVPPTPFSGAARRFLSS